MAFGIKNIIRLTRAASMLWIVALGACSDPAGDVPWRSDEPDDQNVVGEHSCTMGLYIRIGDSVVKGESRAATPPADGHYIQGTAYENYIQLEGETPDLRIYLFTTGDKLISEITDPRLDAMAAMGGGVTTYELTFRVDEILPDCYDKPSFKVVMLANWRQYPSGEELQAGVTTIADLVGSAEGVADYTPSPAVLDADSRIPFFGVTQYDNVVFKADKVTRAEEPLWLLRAYAKIEVLDEASTVTPIQGVKLVRYNTRLYKAPLNVAHQDDYVRFDYGNDDDFVAMPSLPAADPAQWATADAMTVQRREADGHFVAYVPEYRNVDYGLDGSRTERADRCWLEVTYEDGNTFVIPFRYGDGAPSGTTPGAPYDLLRNYWYKFICKRNDSELTWSVDVVPYGEVNLEPDFGIKP